MSAILDRALRTLPDKQRFKDISANEAAMHIVTHDTPGLEVVEEWRYEVAMEACGSDE